MSRLEVKHVQQSKRELASGPEPERQGGQGTLTRLDILGSYRVAEFATLARDGSPVCWPLAPSLEHGCLHFSTGYVYPSKARNAQRNPRVAALFSDPTASGRSDHDPLVLVQGLAAVADQDLQRNTERYVDQILARGPLPFRLTLRTPGVRQLLVGYLARIWIEVTPQQEHVWARGGQPAGRLQAAARPASFSPGAGIPLPEEVFAWEPRYERLPVLAYVDPDGWPAATRVQASLRRDHVALEGGPVAGEGAPACLTYHRLVGNYVANDSFLIRGHFDAAGRLIPEKVIGFTGTADDRGLGSVKTLRVLLGFRGQLAARLEQEGRPLPVVRPTPKGARSTHLKGGL